MRKQRCDGFKKTPEYTCYTTFWESHGEDCFDVNPSAHAIVWKHKENKKFHKQKEKCVTLGCESHPAHELKKTYSECFESYKAFYKRQNPTVAGASPPPKPCGWNTFLSNVPYFIKDKKRRLRHVTARTTSPQI